MAVETAAFSRKGSGSGARTKAKTITCGRSASHVTSAIPHWGGAVRGEGKPDSVNHVSRPVLIGEGLHEEFRRRVKTQGSLPSEDAAVVLLFSLVASGQIKLRRIDGWRKIAAVLSQNRVVEGLRKTG